MSDTAPLPPPAPARPGRGLRIALILSVMLNVLVIGTLAGGAIRLARMETPLQGIADVRALYRALPDEARDTLRAMAREQGFPGERTPRLDRDARRAQIASVNRTLAQALRAETFDPAAFATLLDGDRTMIAERMEAASAAFAARIAALTPEQRRAMADRFETLQQRRLRHD